MTKPEREFFVEAVDGTRLYTRVRAHVPAQSAHAGCAGTNDTSERAQTAPDVRALFCDGLCCDGFIYKYLWDDLSEVCSLAHFHYRGHGRSELPRDPNRIGVEALTDDLLSVLSKLECERVVLIGHSLGTQVALEAYRKRPDLIAGLVLICGSFGRVTHTFKGSNLLATVLPDLIEWVTRHPKFARALWARVPVGVALRIAGLIGDINVRAVRAEDVAPYFQHVVHVDFEMFLRMLNSAGEHSAEDVLPSITVPTLIMAGQRDTITPPDLSRAMQKAILGSELCMIENGTHIAPLEHRQLFAKQIRNFLYESPVLRGAPSNREDE